MFAKVIGRSNSSGTLASAVARTAAALAEFHIAGLPTNLGQLGAILDEPSVAAGDARTTLLAEKPELASPDGGRSGKPVGALALLAQQGGGPGRKAPAPVAPASLPVGDGEEGVEAPMGGTVLEASVAVGAKVSAGDTLMVISAMKMETSVTAPCAGS